jgi:hypothetical protein
MIVVQITNDPVKVLLSWASSFSRNANVIRYENTNHHQQQPVMRSDLARSSAMDVWEYT